MGPRALNEEQMTSVIKILDKYLTEHFSKQEQRHEQRRDEDYDDETEDQLLDEVCLSKILNSFLNFIFHFAKFFKDDFDALILSKISDIIHSLFKVYKTNFTLPFGQIASHFVKLLVSFIECYFFS